MPSYTESGRTARRVAKARRRKPPARPPVIQKTSRYTRPNPPAPKPYSPPRTTRSDAAQGPPTKAERKEINRRARKVKARVQRRARKQFFPKNAVKGVRRSERRAIRSLAEWRRQDPEAYERRRDPDEVFGLKQLGFIEREAEGRGVLPKAAQALKKQIDKSQPRATKSLGIDRGAPGKEILDITANLPSSIYMAGAAGKEAAQGRPARAKKLWEDYKRTSAIPAAVSGDWKEAAKRAKEHPVATVLELSGGKAVLGRGAGAAARKAPSKRVRKAASTNRPNLRLDPRARPGLGPEVERRYSKDIINKAAQTYAERRTRKGSRVRKRGPYAGTQRRPGRDPNVDRGTYLVPALPRRMGGAASRPGAPVRRTAIRRADTRFFQAQRVATHRKEQAAKEMGKIAPISRLRGKVPGSLKPSEGTGIQLAAEGVLRRATSAKSARAGLQRRRNMLVKAGPALKSKDPVRYQLNRAELKDVRELLALDDANLQRMIGAADDVARQQANVQRRGRKVGAFTETGQAKRFYPALQTHIRRPARTENRLLTRDEVLDRPTQKAILRRARRGQELPPRLAERMAAPARARIAPQSKPVKGGPDPRTLQLAADAAGVRLPIQLIARTDKGFRGGYGGTKTALDGSKYHRIYFNPTHGPGARNEALWHELRHAADVEGGRAQRGTQGLTPEQYAKLPSEIRANAFANRNMDYDLWSPPSLRQMATLRTPRPSEGRVWSRTAPETAWFNPRPRAKRPQHGRGVVTTDGKLHTWNESEGTHVEVTAARGLKPDVEFTIRPDGTVITYKGLGTIDEAIAAARIIAMDPRLKAQAAIARMPEFKAEMARLRAEGLRAQRTTTYGPKIGQSRLVSLRDVPGALSKVRRRERVPGRALLPDELASTSRVLQRRERQGKEGLAGMPEGGPVLVTQRPPGSGSSGNKPFPLPTEPSRSRVGTAFEEGSRQVGSEAMMRQATTSEAAVTAAEGFQLLNREWAQAAGKDGQFYADSFAEAQLTARLKTLDPETGNLLPDAVPLVPVNIAEFRLFGTRLRRKQEESRPLTAAREWESEIEMRALAETWDAALRESGKGRWVLWPEDVVQRLREHANVGAHGALHGITNHFKDVVLTSSSPARWIGGNISDITMRTVMEGITPLDIVRGRMVVRRAAKEGIQGEWAGASTTGGGLYHAAEALSRSFHPRAYGENPARTVAAAPWRIWKGGVYAIEHFIEELPQWGRVGKAMRQDVGRSYEAKIGAAQVKRSTPAQFARAVERAQQRTPEGYLTKYSDADYAKLETYLAPDGKSGAAIRRLPNGEGELVNLFAMKGSQYRGTQVLSAMERRGATRLDATSVRGAGLEKFYSRHGWKVDREEPWDPQYGPPPVPGSRVVYMSRDPRAQRAQDVAMKSDLRSLIKLHDQQVNNYAHRLATDQAMEARIQRLTEDVIGRWGKVSPSMRRALVIAPFAQWLGAATRYVYVTLPTQHPIKTGLLAGISEMTLEERKALGLSYFLPRDKQIMDYQMGALPFNVKRNQYGDNEITGLPTSRMTSFGTAAGVPGNIGDFLLPQFAGALDAWAGTSFTQEPLVYPDWWPDETKRRLPIPPDERQRIGVGALIESTVPFASMFRRSVLDKGGPSEPFSTIITPAQRKKWDKENKQFTENRGTVLGGLLEWLTPVAPVGRLYDYGTGKAIEEQGITGETLERWGREAKAKKRKRGKVGVPLRDGSLMPSNSGGTIDLRGGGSTTPQPSSGLIPLR